ncbi:hypothetical protein N0V84_000448 [Fusarium piperis]|uniref:Uncharacterized protein n=1 Tax=Fusarium piperis TaxID=1435070 RepID=A0A9W9BTI5_9HYPO|nr:hypothetical protein N0V84_000448 [Fusarium piperis]
MAIARDRGESVIEAYQFHVAITVPAIWKDYARQDLEKAVKNAGILDRRTAGKTILTFAPEPEAAALSTLGGNPRRAMCISFAMLEVAQSVYPILLSEAVEGTDRLNNAGGLCGGIFIDQAFEAMVRDRLGRKWNQISLSGIKEMLKDDWELSIKPQYKPGNGKKE